MKLKNLVCSLFLLSVAFSGVAQSEKADKKYADYAYVDAIKVYERVAEKGYKDEAMFQRLANAYYFNGELTKANKWYDALFEMNANQDSEYYYRYAQTLKSVDNYAKADEVLVKFRQKFETGVRGAAIQENTNYLSEIKANSGRFEIADAGINSPYSDFGSFVFNNRLIFASARDTGGVAKKTFKWTNTSFTNLYGVPLLPDGSIGSPERLKKKINSKFNESTPIFTKDGKTIYFTRNNFSNGKRGRNDNKVTLLKIYRATLENEEWTNVIELPFNSDQYSIAHPALSPDEKTLYFASDMPGTIGQSDLFKVTINQDGTFGKPQNLGNAINTEGRETFPFISGDNELYFATDGRPGLGGLDVYVAKINNDGAFTDLNNVGEPINSKEDDFAFYINSENRSGFFSSNRAGGNGFDDIYRLTETQKLVCSQELVGRISDRETNEVLSKAKITIYNDQHELVTEVYSNTNGSYGVPELNCKKKYFVVVSKEDYETKEIPFTIGLFSGKTPLEVLLEKRIKAVAVGTDLAKTLDIPIIYFALDKATISKEAEFDLEKVLAVLDQNPNMKLDVRSHTDSRQTAKYNQILSDKRAKATIAWFIKNGINIARISGKGYGESQLVNQCSDGVKCSEKEHRKNRRSEFIITEM